MERQALDIHFLSMNAGNYDHCRQQNGHTQGDKSFFIMLIPLLFIDRLKRLDVVVEDDVSGRSCSWLHDGCLRVQDGCFGPSA